MWNKLPTILKQLNNVTSFKSKLKEWLILTKDYIISAREALDTDLHTDAEVNGLT